VATAKDETLEHLRQKLRAKMNDLADYVAADGKCENFDDYRYMVGQIHGLAQAERDLLDIDDMLHRTDD